MKLEKVTGGRINLDNFDRSQEVKRVYVRENGRWILIDRVWTMDWSPEHKREVAANLLSDETISYIAHDGGRILGFVSVLKKPVGCRMVLDMIQVDRAYRGQGLGRRLFEMAALEAKKAGVKELYISACCSEETVGFYKAMGAAVTDDPIPEIAEAEPCDVQMVCSVAPKHRLYLVEGLPCSGKSTTAAFVAGLLGEKGPVCFADEGSGEHPADYEFHAMAPAGLVSEEAKVVSLRDYTGELLHKLLPYKIYDGLPWEAEQPLMLEKWRQFVASAEAHLVYVFNCVLLQNPMCETMMRFGFPEEVSQSYIEEIAELIGPLNPVVIYLKNEDIAASVEKAAAERPGWLDAVIGYHCSGAYGKSIGAKGFDGYIRCLQERQERELRILSRLPVKCLIVENPQRDWAAAYETIRAFLAEHR